MDGVWLEAGWLGRGLDARGYAVVHGFELRVCVEAGSVVKDIVLEHLEAL